MRNQMKFKSGAFSAAILVLLLMAGCDQKPAIPQQAKDAVIALKKLEAKVQTGINYPDYVSSVGEAVFAVNLLVDNPNNKHPELTNAIRDALADYKFAGEVWKLRIDRTLRPRDVGVPGAIRLTDSEAQNILSKIPTANKAVSMELIAQMKKNELALAKKTLGVASPDDRVRPLEPKKDDGAIFERQGYSKDRQVGEYVVRQKGEKPETIQYLDLEIVFRLLWLRAGESLAKAYKMTSTNG